MRDCSSVPSNTTVFLWSDRIPTPWTLEKLSQMQNNFRLSISFVAPSVVEDLPQDRQRNKHQVKTIDFWHSYEYPYIRFYPQLDRHFIRTSYVHKNPQGHHRIIFWWWSLVELSWRILWWRTVEVRWISVISAFGRLIWSSYSIICQSCLFFFVNLPWLLTVDIYSQVFRSLTSCQYPRLPPYYSPRRLQEEHE